ncbi:MAG: 2-dehydro-3-deoxygalactonokinase [Desulfitobacteriaceae bacterium]
MKVLVVDSGTTTSRVRLSDGNNVLASVSRLAGAKDVALTGNNEVLKNALRECIKEILEESKITIDEVNAIIASGMISSNMGLVEIPHLSGPVGISETAGNLVKRLFPDITSKPIWFIPGIKTGFHKGNTISEMDIMRGEETEIFGYMDDREDSLFMHYGSHHKCILTEEGKVRQCRTSVTGELMMAISQNTILKSSLVPINDIIVDMDWVRRGLAVAEESGFGRALFSTRIIDTMVHSTKMEATNFYLGVLVSLDLNIMKELRVESVRKLVLYGKKLFPSIFEPIIQERFPELQVITVSEELSDLLSVKGAIKTYRASIK